MFSFNEEKTSEIQRVRNLLSSYSKESSSKLTILDSKILEICENFDTKDLKSSMSNAIARINSLEEKLAKGFNETAYTIKHRDQLIESRLSYLEQERLNIEELKAKLVLRSENESFLDTVESKQEKSLNERIAKLEKFGIRRNSLKCRETEASENRFTEINDVLPAEAASIVVTSVLEKINKQNHQKISENIKKIKKTKY